ncbi:VOC family protein [Paracoccus lutimaris]|uniref:Glyoxalase-like protein n=1 Tax=Paracoccus lutimaris TaxID=1490030 RepID=A0A368YMF2_9RHOB|nr:VOC family protein [Paracoccus lutimaris]RCW80769.1 glyoxalase-like protein [Paracoccus lutimaris]
MPHPVLGIDHVFLLVKDLDASAAQFRRLGFTLSPRGLHSAEKGTANYTLIFEHDYCELLGIVAETERNRPQRDMLAEDGEGLRAIACRIGSAREARKGLAALGIATEPVSEFSRPLALPDGSSGLAAFASTDLAVDEAPSGYMFLCQHKTPDMVWRPELQSHANGAQALAGIVTMANDTETLARRFARLFAAGRVRTIPGGHAVETGTHSARILCLTPAAAAARYDDSAVADTPPRGYAALQIAVTNPAVTRELLIGAGIAAHRGPEGAVWVGPSDACGTVLEFVQG